jgi:hypothetical protein
LTHKKTPQSGVFLCIPGVDRESNTNYLAADASAAGAEASAAGAAGAAAGASTAGAAGAATSSFLPQADRAAAAMMAAKTRDLFMVIFLIGVDNNFRKLSKIYSSWLEPRQKHSSSFVLRHKLYRFP